MEQQYSLFSSQEQEAISYHRNYKVVKANYFIQKARFNLPLKAQKLLLYAISQIDNRHIKGKTYVIDIPHFCRVCGIDTTKGNYKHIYKAIDQIKSAHFWLKPTPTARREKIDWIVNVSVQETTSFYDEEKAIPLKISFKFDERLEDYLFELTEFFTSYRLLNILAMKSRYSIRLYEVLKSYENIKTVQITLDELRAILEIEKYKEFSELNRNVIKKALSEINSLTDINASATFIRGDRATVTGIEFNISPKQTIDAYHTALLVEAAIQGHSARSGVPGTP